MTQWTKLAKIPRAILNSDVYAVEDWELTSAWKGRPRKIKLNFEGGTTHIWQRMERRGAWKMVDCIRHPKPYTSPGIPLIAQFTVEQLTQPLPLEIKQAQHRAWTTYQHDCRGLASKHGLWASYQTYRKACDDLGIIWTQFGFRWINPAELTPQAILENLAKTSEPSLAAEQ